jgi:hypothetical protein
MRKIELNALASLTTLASVKLSVIAATNTPTEGFAHRDALILSRDAT